MLFTTARRLAHCQMAAFLVLATAASGCKNSTSSVKDDAVPKVASGIKVGPVGEEDMAELKLLRDNFLSLASSKAGLDKFLNDLATNYKASPANVKIVAAHMLLLRPLRSIVYRAAPVLEKQHATHSLLLTAVQQIAASTKTFLPTDQWTAVLNYVTEPFDKTTPTFATVADMQAELLQPGGMIELLSSLATDLDQLPLADSAPAVWDNRILYGAGSFRDARDRFVKLGAAEKWSAAANLHSYLVSLRVFCSYNLNDLPAAMQAIGTLSGVDGFWTGQVRGSPLMLRAEQLRKFPDFLTFHNKPGEQGPEQMKAALKDLRSAVAAMRESYNATLERGKALGGQVDEFYAIRPDRALPSQRPTDLALKDMEAIVAGKATLLSAITNDEVTIDVPAFFNAPQTDLKNFLPAPEQFDQTLTKDVDGLSVRNYFWGSPTGWNKDAFATIFPALQNPSDVAVASRVLAQSWGGGMVNLPLMSFIN